MLDGVLIQEHLSSTLGENVSSTVLRTAWSVTLRWAFAVEGPSRLQLGVLVRTSRWQAALLPCVQLSGNLEQGGNSCPQSPAPTLSV